MSRTFLLSADPRRYDGTLPNTLVSDRAGQIVYTKDHEPDWAGEFLLYDDPACRSMLGDVRATDLCPATVTYEKGDKDQQERPPTLPTVAAINEAVLVLGADEDRPLTEAVLTLARAIDTARAAHAEGA